MSIEDNILFAFKFKFNRPGMMFLHVIVNSQNCDYTSLIRYKGTPGFAKLPRLWLYLTTLCKLFFIKLFLIFRITEFNFFLKRYESCNWMHLICNDSV